MKSDALKALHVLLQVTWPCIPRHTTKIMNILLTLVCDIKVDERETLNSVKQEIMDKIHSCLVLLQKIDHVKVAVAVNAVKDANLDVPQLRSFLSDTFQHECKGDISVQESL